MVTLNTNYQLASRLLCCAFMFALLGTGCSSAPADQVTIQLFASPPPGVDPYAGVGKLVIRIKAEGQADIEAAEDFALEGTRQIPLPPIPFLDDGTPQQIVIEGWSVSETGEFTANSKLVSIGRTPEFSLTPDDEPMSFYVQMARINSFVPLTDALDGNIQNLTMGRVGHTVTTATGGETLIAGGATPLTDAAPWWGPGGVASYISTVEMMNSVTQNLSPLLTTEGASSGLLVSRMWHTGTALPTGDIFFAGGWGQAEFSGECPSGAGIPTYASCTIEWYQPGGAIGLLQTPLSKARAGHTATLVDPDTPTILFIGGDLDGEGTYELWDPHSGTQGAVALPDNSTRRYHAAVKAQVYDTSDPPVLADVVVIFGGESDTDPLDTGLFYVVEGGQMLPNYTQVLPGGPRTQLTGTYIPDLGLINFVGGFEDLDHTLASPAIDSYNTKAADPFTPFYDKKQTIIPPPKIKASDAGSEGSQGCLLDGITYAAEDVVPSELEEGRCKCNMTNVGFEIICEPPCYEVELQLEHPRGGHTTSLIQDSLMIVLGGSDGASAVGDIEIVHDFKTERCSASLGGNQVTQVVGSVCTDPAGCAGVTLDPMPFASNGHRALVLDSGNVLMVGGVSTSAADSTNTVQSLYLFVPNSCSIQHLGR